MPPSGRGPAEGSVDSPPSDYRPGDSSTDGTTLAFVCVHDDGRCQVAAAFARYERDRRDLGDRVEVLAGGIDVADDPYEPLVSVVEEVGIDVPAPGPRAVTTDELATADHVITMGRSTLDLLPTADPATRAWALEDPRGEPRTVVRHVRDEIYRLVVALFDELFGATG